MTVKELDDKIKKGLGGVYLFYGEEEYLKHKDAFILDLDKLKGAKAELTIMHPLPSLRPHPAAHTFGKRCTIG